jgi:hypothetical protein
MSKAAAEKLDDTFMSVADLTEYLHERNIALANKSIEGMSRAQEARKAYIGSASSSRAAMARARAARSKRSSIG